jgi:hypothetical protein
MGQNTCHLISSVLELLLNKFLLALIVTIIYESEYSFVESTVMWNAKIMWLIKMVISFL